MTKRIRSKIFKNIVLLIYPIARNQTFKTLGKIFISDSGAALLLSVMIQAIVISIFVGALLAKSSNFMRFSISTTKTSEANLFWNNVTSVLSNTNLCTSAFYPAGIKFDPMQNNPTTQPLSIPAGLYIYPNYQAFDPGGSVPGPTGPAVPLIPSPLSAYPNNRITLNSDLVVSEVGLIAYNDSTVTPPNYPAAPTTFSGHSSIKRPTIGGQYQQSMVTLRVMISTAGSQKTSSTSTGTVGGSLNIFYRSTNLQILQDSTGAIYNCQVFFTPLQALPDTVSAGQTCDSPGATVFNGTKFLLCNQFGDLHNHDAWDPPQAANTWEEYVK